MAKCKCVRSYVICRNGETTAVQEDDIVDLSITDEMVVKGFLVVIEEAPPKPSKKK